MSAFSQLIASIGKPQGSSGEASSAPKPTGPGRPANGLTANNAAAGVKRKTDEAAGAPQSKAMKSEQGTAPARPFAPSNRFQLSAKGSYGQKPAAQPNHPSPKPATSSNAQKFASNPAQRSTTTTGSPAPQANANGAPPAKRGFASIMAKAAAAQEAAKAAGPSGIKHKPVEKLSRKERARLLEEQKAQQKSAGKGGKAGAGAGHPADRSRSGTPVAAAGQKKKGAELSYKGTSKKPAVERQPLAYKGTMRSIDPATAREKEKKKRLNEDKYGGYANWSDLSDAEEDEEEEDYESDVSSDMEGGFDDVEREEMSALRAARKEDQEALAEEERLKREKAERKRKLQMLSKTAAARKKF